ncbi:RAD50-interacting protein 1-like [Apostichopus japonicus]|uniref:RAD50-interacting protein 1-like n=1 Tax=Stichopus japonicus TaxID=307972 RepID=UPI003AB5D785
MAEENLQFTPKIVQHLSQLIDHEFGDDVKALEKVEELLQDAVKRRDKLKTDLNVATAEIPTEIRKALTEADSSITRIDEITLEYKQVRRGVTGQLTDVEPMVEGLKEMVSKVRVLERSLDYIKWLMLVEELSSEIQGSLLVTTAPPSLFTSTDVQKSLSANATPSAVSHFSKLSQVYESLQESKCHHLLEFVESTVMFWYRILMEKLAGEFSEITKALGWPFVTVASPMPPSAATVEELKMRLDACFSYLVKLQLPDILAETEDKATKGIELLPGSQPILLPIQLLLDPLLKRFKYHFFGNRQTNAVDKPEWYFTQILNWVRDHSHFLEQTIQPILNKSEISNIVAKVEFTRGLLQLAAKKLKIDIPDIIFDDQLLSHTIDELLLFDKELRSQYGYPDHEPGCLHVLTEKQCFEKWISVEKNFAGQKMDVLLASKTAWISQYKDVTNIDDAKVPECVENFMTLILVITERYKSLPSPTHHLRFLELQLDLIDDFRIRLLQVMKLKSSAPLSGQYCAIVNGIEYILGVLEEWSNQLFFIQLNFFKKEQQSMEKINAALESNMEMDEEAFSKISPSNDTGSEEFYQGSVFDSTVELYSHLKQEMLQTLRRVIIEEIKDRCWDYQHHKWLTLPSHKDFITPSITTSFCDVLQTCKARLHEVQELLSAVVFNILWEAVADSLGQFIFDRVIMNGQFNEGGAKQLSYDVSKGLLPVFTDYTSKPESYFRILKDSCTLLNLNKGSLKLLYAILQDEEQEKARAALVDMKVYKLSVSQAMRVLKLRADI